MNFKINLVDKDAPLKVFVTYLQPVSASTLPGTLATHSSPLSSTLEQNKVVEAFLSHMNKEPTEDRNTSCFVNPQVILVGGNKINKQSGKLSFEKDWVYISLKSTGSDIRVRLNPRFKSDVGGKKSGYSQERSVPASIPDIQQTGYFSSLSLEQLEFMINAKTRSAKDNMYVVQKLQEDENLWEKYQMKIRDI